MRTTMAGGYRSHFILPGIDQLSPDLKRLINEALFRSTWTPEALEPPHRVICTVSALMALGQLPLLKRHIERGLNVGLTPEEIVEVFIQLTFYVGVPAVETAMRTAKEIFEEQGIQFTPNQVYDSNQSVEACTNEASPLTRSTWGIASNIKTITQTRKRLNWNA